MNATRKYRFDGGRREIIKNSTSLLGGIFIIPSHVLGGRGKIAPSDKIGLGFIGTGKQGKGLASRFSKLPDAQIIAASDVDSQKLALFKAHVATATAENETSVSDCHTYANYHELLKNPGVDAVVIASPDHWHAAMSIDAMRKGKDVFCEKPLTHTVNEGRRMAKAVIKYGSVLQTGSMQRSSKNFRHAVNLVRNGYLGEITKILVSVGDPAIVCDLPPQSAPAEINWDGWVGPATMRPYSAVLAHPQGTKGWAQWRQYQEFGGGNLCDWGAHMFDIAQWALKMDRSGPVLFIPPADPLAKRGLKIIYDSGVEMVHEDFERGWAVRFIGSKGTLDVSRKFLDSDPINIAQAKLAGNEKSVYHSNDHYQDWLNCIKTRKQPICDVETGHRSASVCNLANIAYRMRRPLRWDPIKEQFAKNKEANKYLKMKYRKPYKLRS